MCRSWSAGCSKAPKGGGPITSPRRSSPANRSTPTSPSRYRCIGFMSPRGRRRTVSCNSARTSTTATALACRPSRRKLSCSGFASRLSRQAQELCGGAPEHCDFVVRAEFWRRHDQSNRVFRPVKSIVSADHDVIAADHGGEVAQPFGRKDQRVHVDLFEIFSRLLFERDVL